MDSGSGGDQLREGWRALDAARWDAARAAFEAALDVEETPEALSGLGQALWFLGSVQEGISARERAFEGYVRAGRCDEAARVGVWVSHQYSLAGRASAARGWLARAERALEPASGCAGHGWVAVERARHAESIEESIEHAQRAMAIARETGAADLEVFALSVLGRAEVSAGRLEEGMRLLEEAMAAAAGERARDVHTVGEAYCNLITACTSAGEWERAAEWCELVDDFARGHDVTPLLGACRTIHADVLLAAGRWSDAERALESALASHARYVPEMGAPTIATMAELRVRQGRLPEAEQLLADREEHPASLRALALLRIAEDEPRVAAALLERGLMAAGDDAMRATQLLAPLVDARLAGGDVPGAESAARRLEELARSSGIGLVEARADLAAARVALAAGRTSEAAEAARRALAAFSRLAMPLDTGEARLELARALVGEAPDLARDEARTAFSAFRQLGASRAMDGAAAVLRDLGAGTAGRARSYGELTAREQEVLGLLALGMSNARIGQTLFISEKTAGHHVSRILSKLGVRNRAEAAAHAARAERVAAARMGGK
jgi:ATP/maltotriose-dependent transcriptional regulator MalT